MFATDSGSQSIIYPPIMGFHWVEWCFMGCTKCTAKYYLVKIGKTQTTLWFREFQSASRDSGFQSAPDVSSDMAL